ncbi:MAG: RecX family transcriptional regulator, partial [Butyrivibrio sp.]|nr:RecX family transcriptional regulator [Butyrivibrio sp.]
MLVTDIAPFDKKRRRIYIDYEYAFPLYLSELKKYGIEAESELPEAVYAEITSMLERRARERILYLIGDADRTERNIREKLRASGYVGDIADRAVESLKRYGYIDDTRYAKAYAEALRDGRNKSVRAIE